MAIKKVRIKPPGYTDIVHPETSADVVIESTTKRFVSDTDKANWNAKWDYNENTIKNVKVNNAVNADTVNGKTVESNVPSNAKFTDTTYSEISTSEIDAGTSSTLRTITGRRIKYILDKVQGWINALTKADIGLNNVDNVKQASKTEFDAHKAENVSQGEGAHGIRFKDKNLQYFDAETQQWELASPPPPQVYGIEIDESNANPETSVVYTDDAVGFTPASGNNGSFDWGSWESIIKDVFKIRPVVLENLGGGNATVNYELQYDDYTKKLDGSNSNLTGTDGDVMIEFGVPLWWKFTRIGNKLKIQLSTKEFGGAVKHAFEIEKGYNQVPIYPLFLTQILYLLMFKNLDSQTALGRGRVDFSTANYGTTGRSNTDTFNYGETGGQTHMKFLGMEDYWGNRRWWIDGCFYDSNRNILIGKGNFNDTGSGYENFGQASSANLGGYIDKVQGGNNTGFIPASTGGSATTYFCDYGHLYGGRLPYFGGYSLNGDSAGGFYLYSATASDSIANLGGRLFYSNGNDKIYIGAYLGVNQSSKLRSISGQTSHNNATIGAFRTLAKANNN